VQPGHRLQHVGVDVRLIEAVEEHEPIRAGGSQARAPDATATRRRATASPRWESFRRTPRTMSSNRRSTSAPFSGVGREVIEVQFKGVGAGVLNLLSVVQPALVRRAVE
jgi:hypothetical protein